MHEGRGKTLILLAVTLIVAFLLRLDFLQASQVAIDADEAIVGLMAKHALEGADMPVFYYGQHYMGSFEPWLVSKVFTYFGISAISLKSVPLFFSLLLVVVVYALGNEIAGRRAGLLSALFVAVPPSTLVIWSTKARGGFIELLVIGALSLLLAVKWLKQDSPRLSSTIVVGALLGFGWWVNNQIIFFMAPIGLMFIYHCLLNLKKRRVLSLIEHFISGLAGFFGGGVLFWLYNLRNDFISFEMFGASDSTDMLEHADGLFSVAIPILIGAKRFWQTHDVFPNSTLIAYILYGFSLLALLFIANKFFKRGLALIFIFVASVFLIFVVSSFGWLVEAPRYLLPSYVGIAVLVGAAITAVRSRNNIAGLVLCAGIFALNLTSIYYGGITVPGEPFVFKGQRVSRDHSSLVEWLKDNNVKWVRTNYWIGYRLAFETNEEVKFLVFQDPDQTRIDGYILEAKYSGQDAETMPLVLVPSQANIVKRALSIMGYTFKSTQAGKYVIVFDLKAPESSERIDPSLIQSLQASHGESTTANAVDVDLKTRWASASPQIDGMSLKVVFSSSQDLSRISYELGQWIHDYPRGLAIKAELENGQEVFLLRPREYRAVRYYVKGDESFDFYFDKTRVKSITFVQKGAHPILDWSVAELGFYK